MSWLDTGAAAGTMATGVSALTAAAVWLRNQFREWSAERAEKATRTWDGYIDLGGISSWRVELAEEPDVPSPRVVLEVVESQGGNRDHDISRAYDLRQRVKADGFLARIPTPEEYEFLKALRKDRGYGQGGRPVR